MNVLIQTLFQIEEFLLKILYFNPPEDLTTMLEEMKVTEPNVITRKKVKIDEIQSEFKCVIGICDVG